MIKRRRSITGYLSPKTRKHSFFILCICLLACIITGITPNFQSTVSLQNRTGVKLPILMYHSVLNDANRENKYVITPEDFEKDLQFLKENGFQTITTADLIAYKENQIALPEKPVMITFDDGYYNNYSYVFPLLKKYEMKMVLSVMGKPADEYSREGEVMNNNYSHATWTMLKEMCASGYVEIQNHSYDLHNWSERRGILRKKGEDSAHYAQVLFNDLTKMQERIANNVGVPATAFTYPFGAVNKESRSIVEKVGFSVTYGCEEGINVLAPDSDLKELKRYNRPGDADRTKFFNRILKELEQG